MNVEVKIKIETENITDELSYSAAKELYEELKKIFEPEKETIYFPYTPYIPYTPPVVTPPWEIGNWPNTAPGTGDRPWTVTYEVTHKDRT